MPIHRAMNAKSESYEKIRRELPEQYSIKDLGQFSPSGAIYFMNGYSAAKVRLLESGQELEFEWFDENTSIASTEPFLRDDKRLEQDGAFVPVPPPLRPTAFYPVNTPKRYREDTTLHLMQVVSMNMRSKDGSSRLLIGLPFAEKYPDLFFAKGNFEDPKVDASSYGVVQSLTSFSEEKGKGRQVQDNGYPARSFFGIYHLLETPMGAFFNKKATQMELQPDKDGKLARALPPIPFVYALVNGPIPLYSVENPKGNPVGEIVDAKHGSHSASTRATGEVWPFNASPPSESRR
jgi:hypothetical protein